MAKSNKPKSKLRKVVNIVSSVVLGAVLLCIIICIISVSVSKAKGQEANIFGYRFLYILTDSMEPDLPVGSSIIVKNCSAEDIKVGDYVCYETDPTLYEESGVKFITHKCIEALHEDKKSGKQVITTQGIKVGAPVDDPIDAQRVQAVFICKVPSWIGKFFSFLITPYGFATLICVPLVLLLALQLFGQIKVILGKEKEKTEEELLQQEIGKQTELITKDAQDFFLKEQEKIKQFLAMQNKADTENNANTEKCNDNQSGNEDNE